MSDTSALSSPDASGLGSPINFDEPPHRFDDSSSDGSRPSNDVTSHLSPDQGTEMSNSQYTDRSRLTRGPEPEGGTNLDASPLRFGSQAGSSPESVRSRLPRSRLYDDAQLSFETAFFEPSLKSDYSQSSKSTNSAKESDTTEKPTTPPRVTFGVEIEFVVAYLEDHKDEIPQEDGLPPVHREMRQSPIMRMANLLFDHDIPVNVPTPAFRPPDYDERRAATGANNHNAWTIDDDGSVSEGNVNFYSWQSVEIKTPASYAYDEAFEMIELVVKLIKSNFRVRVNPECGLHVHVGNGPYRIDFRAARNYAALLWSAEPLLSVLYSPDRAVSMWSQSIRRARASGLAAGEGAEEAYRVAMGDPRWPARYQGRARKLGEAPSASRQKFLERLEQEDKDEEDKDLEPKYESDDSDWEAADSRPFYRPRRVIGKRARTETANDLRNEQRRASGEILTADEMKRLDSSRIVGGPPQLNFPVPEQIQPLSNKDADTSGKLGRPYAPLTRRHTRAPKPETVESILTNKTAIHRLQVYSGLPYPGLTRTSHKNEVTARIMEKSPFRKDTWSGVKEILSCDVGTHQLAFLMNKGYTKNQSSSWVGHCKGRLNTVQGTGIDLALASNPLMTIESRDAMGSLDGEWIATWARINVRLLEWARDAEPAVFMRVIGLIAEQDGKNYPTYDVVDLLTDMGCYQEARHCEQRLKRGAAAWFECMLVDSSMVKEGKVWGESDAPTRNETGTSN